MSQISLSASMRSNLMSLQGTSNLMNQTQERLASGKKVNSAIDNPSSYYTAQSLTNRANDLSGLLDSMGQAISTIKAANEGIESITSFVEQAKAVATSALSTTDAAQRKSYMEQFNNLRIEIDHLAKDSGYKGINLLDNGNLTVTFNEGRTNQLEIKGVDASTAGIGIDEATGWDTSDDLSTYEKAVSDAQAAYDEAVAKGTPESKVKDDTVNAQGKVVAGTYAAGDIITDGEIYYRVKAAWTVSGDATDAAGSATGDGAKLEVVTKSDNDLYYTAAEAEDVTAKAGAIETAETNLENAKKVTGTQKINDAIDAATDAIDVLRDYASGFGNNYSIVQTRQSFTENLINVLEEGADKLTLADMNEEAANM